MFDLYLLCEVLPSGKIEPEGKIEVIYGLPLDLFPESACQGFFVKKQPLYYIFTPSHLQI